MSSSREGRSRRSKRPRRDSSVTGNEEGVDGDDSLLLATPEPQPSSLRGEEDEKPSAAPPAALPSHQEDESLVLRPDMVKFVRMPKSHVNHTYRNFSNIPVAVDNDITQRPLDDMNFHEKVYHLLTSSKAVYKEAIQWCAHGRAFEIVDTTKLSKFGILRVYFGSNVVPQFRKLLHSHGYKQLTMNLGGMEAYYSEFLLRGLPHVLRYAPPPTEARNVLPDPSNEPDFTEIARLYPLPGQKQALVAEARDQLRRRGIVIFGDIFQEVADRWAKK